MSYNNVPIGTPNPGMIVILVDQSSSMNDSFGTELKKNIATLAVNRVIYEILLACQSGIKIKDRCFIAVIGYGSSINVLLGGMISEVAESIIRREQIIKKESDGAGGLIDVNFEMPIWIEAEANGGTPMDKAFQQAGEVVKEWISARPDTFPPIVINITDGEPNDPDSTRLEAERVMQMATSDGNVLVLNAHISSDSSQSELRLPSSETKLYDKYAEFLFSISSELPTPLVEAARGVGFKPDTNARGFVFNAGPETMIKLLNFGSLGTMNIR